MINLKMGTKSVLNTILIVILACIMIVPYGVAFADDQAPEASAEAPEAKAALNASTASAEEAADTPAEEAETPEEEAYDIKAQVITNVKFNKNSGILSWDPVSAPSDKTIHYRVYLKADNITSERYSKFSGGKGLILDTTEVSVDTYNNADFKEAFTDYESADYTFSVKATDGTKTDSGQLRFTKETESAVYSLSYYSLEVQVYTKVYTYDKTKKEFYESLRRVTHSQGGEILLDGKSITDVDGDKVHTVYRAIPGGKTVELEYVPVSGYKFYSERLDDGTNDRNADTTRSLKMNKSHKLVVYFIQPFAEIITSGIKAASDNFEEIAIITLVDDAAEAGMKSGIEGYMQMKVDTVSAGDLSDADKDVCSNDDALRSQKIKRGSFFEISLYESLDKSKPSKIKRTPEQVNISLTIPDSLKTSDTNIRRTFYLIKVDNGEADIIADGTSDKISGNITDAGLYMIGYKDTNLEGINSGSTSRTSTSTGNTSTGTGSSYTYTEAEPEEGQEQEAASEPVPEPAPAIEAPETEKAAPSITEEPKKSQDKGGFPVAATAAAGTAAVGGAFGLRYLLAALARRRR